MLGKSLIEVWDARFVTAGFICSCLIGASYPLTQVYQHKEDQERGDKTLSILLGVNGTFVFAALLFIAATVLMFVYWAEVSQLQNFCIDGLD